MHFKGATAGARATTVIYTLRIEPLGGLICQETPAMSTSRHEVTLYDLDQYQR